MDDGKGNVAGIKTMKVEWTKDKAGRWNMADVAGMLCRALEHF